MITQQHTGTGDNIAGTLVRRSIVIPKQESNHVVSPRFENVPGVDPSLYPYPTQNNEGDAGYDFVYTGKHPKKIAPGGTLEFYTGVACALPPDMHLLLQIRHSIAVKKKLRLTNVQGIIDSGYYNNPKNYGNIGVSLYNFGEEAITVFPGERLVQGIILRHYQATNCNSTDTRGGSSHF